MTSLIQLACRRRRSCGTPPRRPRSEAQLALPDFHQVKFMGISGWNILALGLVACALGLLFGVWKYQKLKNLPVHKAMREISELIYATCKTYLRTQAKFIAWLWVLIAAVIVVYFAVLEKVPRRQGHRDRRVLGARHPR